MQIAIIGGVLFSCAFLALTMRSFFIKKWFFLVIMATCTFQAFQASSQTTAPLVKSSTAPSMSSAATAPTTLTLPTLGGFVCNSPQGSMIECFSTFVVGKIDRIWQGQTSLSGNHMLAIQSEDEKINVKLYSPIEKVGLENKYPEEDDREGYINQTYNLRTQINSCEQIALAAITTKSSFTMKFFVPANDPQYPGDAFLKQYLFRDNQWSINLFYNGYVKYLQCSLKN